MPPNTDFGWPYTHVTQSTLCMTGPGTLHCVVLNGITTVGDVTIYDGVDNAGVVIAVLSLRTAVHVSFQPVNFLYDARVATGIFIESAGTFAGDLTVMHS